MFHRKSIDKDIIALRTLATEMVQISTQSINTYVVSSPTSTTRDVQSTKVSQEK